MREPTHGDSPIVIGRYALSAELATGGMATVYLARLLGEAGFRRLVAIKRLHAQFARDPQFAEMFVEEARLVARIRHPNVVPTLDVVSAERELFLVMEYVEGESLASLIRSASAAGERPPPRVAASILGGVLHGLHAAHEAVDKRGAPLGLVHRDVSPQNILVGVDGVARVLDFGIAKAVGRTPTTREGSVKGKLAYMAPEQLRGEPVTRQADIYAAAVVLWETLTAQKLFLGDSEAIVVARILGESAPAPSTVAPEVPRGLDEVVRRGLAVDPAARFETARDMALAIEAGVGPVSLVEVTQWIERLAGESLRARAALVATIERQSESVAAAAPMSAPAPTVPIVPTEVSRPNDAERATPALRADAIDAYGPTVAAPVALSETTRKIARRGARSPRVVVTAAAALALLVTSAGVAVLVRSSAASSAASSRSDPPSASSAVDDHVSAAASGAPSAADTPSAASAGSAAVVASSNASATASARPAATARRPPTRTRGGARPPTPFDRIGGRE